MAKELIGTIKTPGSEERTEVWAEEREDHWQIVTVDPEENRVETSLSAKTSVDAMVLVCNEWGNEESDLRLVDED